MMADETRLTALIRMAKGLGDASLPAFGSLGVPENAVRAVMALMLMGGALWMQWQSPEPGALGVPSALISAAGLATGFYLTGDSSHTMKGLVSMVYVAAFVAFLVYRGWVPESVNAQVMTVLGIYFARRLANGTPTPAPPAS